MDIAFVELKREIISWLGLKINQHTYLQTYGIWCIGRITLVFRHIHGYYHYIIYKYTYDCNHISYINLPNRYGMLEKGDEASWNVMLKRYTSEENAQEKRKLLSGLGTF